MQDIFSTDGVRWKIVLHFKFDNNTEQRSVERKQKKLAAQFFTLGSGDKQKAALYECDIYFFNTCLCYIKKNILVSLGFKSWFNITFKLEDIQSPAAFTVQ